MRAVLGREDSAWALDARAAWDSLTASGDAEWVALYELQDFLWYRLPAKFLVPYEHKLAVAEALAGLLEALGYTGHANLCTGAATTQVLDAWEQNSTAEAIGPLTILGMVAVGEWPNRDIALTDVGEPAAKEVLWRPAIAPQGF